MQTVILGRRPAELDALIERRKQRGIDRFDEVWEGSYHMAPAAHPSHGYIDHQIAVVLDPYARRAGLVGTGPFNLGTSEDYRVPDAGYHRGLPSSVWVETAAVVVEVVSPDDETFVKFGFYFEHDVDELLIADPAERSITLWSRGPAAFVLSGVSGILGVTPAELTALISWP